MPLYIEHHASPMLFNFQWGCIEHCRLKSMATSVMLKPRIGFFITLTFMISTHRHPFKILCKLWFQWACENYMENIYNKMALRRQQKAAVIQKMGEQPTLKPCHKHSINVYMWAGISRCPPTPVVFEETKTAKFYMSILWNSLLPFIRSCPDSHRFMQEIAFYHSFVRPILIHIVSCRITILNTLSLLQEGFFSEGN